MNTLSRIIAAEIRKNGPISFARFMHLALYCPVYGYYERQPDNIGRQGDFHTSVSVGPLFGQLLAFQFSRWLESLGAQDEGALHLVEAGAHNGTLATDVLHWFASHQPHLLERVRYCLLEPSEARAAWQRTTLEPFADRIEWIPSLDLLARRTGGVRGILFSNELLDAFPIRRFAWNKPAGHWFEWRVSGDESGFYSVSSPPLAEAEAAAELGWIPAELHPHLPDGYVVETSQPALDWWAKAAQALRAGWLVTFDYGLNDAEALMPERTGGTARAYRRHHAQADLLADPGQQDLTAHVNFSRIIEAGERMGLHTERFEEQGRFLTRTFQMALQSAWAADLQNPTMTRQLRTLVHPDHFGRSFRVLIQRRGVCHFTLPPAPPPTPQTRPSANGP